MKINSLIVVAALSAIGAMHGADAQKKDSRILIYFFNSQNLYKYVNFDNAFSWLRKDLKTAGDIRRCFTKPDEYYVTDKQYIGETGTEPVFEDGDSIEKYETLYVVHDQAGVRAAAIKARADQKKE